MVDQSLKNQNQAASASAQKNSSPERETQTSRLDSKAQGSLQGGKETREIIKQQRDVSSTSAQQLAINTLFHTKTAESQGNKTNINKSPSSLRSRSSNRSERDKKQPHRPGHGESSSSAEEVREMAAIRAANANRRSAAAASNRGQTSRPGGASARQPIDGDIDESLQQKLVGQDNIEESISSGIRYGVGGSPEQENRANTDPSTAANQSLDNIELNTGTETIKLLDVVGPEAILTFREKLQQVWVTLDDNATRQLDVIARMPASLTGATATELLMVESPQGIHFVAFLKNKNDFEVLATFDRRALLPESPSRQLIEAGLIAYEQLDTVFKEGGQKIEQAVKELASTRGTNDTVFNELQRLMVQEKRRRRKFRQMMDYFVDKLDELDLEGDPNDAPFVPNQFSKENSSEIEEDPIENEIEISLDSTEAIDQENERNFGLENEDSEYH